MLCLYIIIQEQDIILGHNYKTNADINGNTIEERVYDNNASILLQECHNSIYNRHISGLITYLTTPC